MNPTLDLLQARTRRHFLQRAGQFSLGSIALNALLGGGAIVIEGLNLRDVEPGIYDMLCLPLRVVGADGAPARVVLRRS